MRRSFSLALASVAGLAVAYGVACGGGGGGGNTDTGGAGQTGGKGQTGGGNPSGGNNPTGGSNPSGGNGGTGGKVSTGGNPSGGTGNSATGGGNPSGGTGNSATGGGGNPTGGSGGGGTRPGGCAIPDGLIADFEDGGTMPVVPKSTIAPAGYWGLFNDKTSGATMTMAVESTGTTDCQKGALHVQGTGFKDWGAGIEVALNHSGTDASPTPLVVDVSAYSGLQFKVKTGSGQSASSPLFVAWATADSEPAAGGGMCTGNADTQCRDHTGRFLRANSSYAVGSDWTTMTMCFDADFMAMYVPEYVPAATRRNMAKRFLKLQILTNKDQDPKNPMMADPHKGEKFDFWLDDIKLIKDCKRPAFASTDAPKAPFPQNKAPGTCSIIPNAAGYNAVLSDMYANWKRQFVVKEGSGLKVVAVEQPNSPVLSEGMGYGMLISAAFGDKPTFDGIWSTVNGHLTGGLLGWTNYGGNSATDGDEDIAYGLLMADKQWGGTYKTAATSMIAQIKAKDFTADGTMKAGEAFAPFNPSYFSPSEYRAFGSDWASIITKNYGYVGGTCASMGLPTDWCNPSSGPINSFQAGANVTNLFCKDSGNCPVLYADDAARIPWRVGMDACVNAAAEGKTLVNKILMTLHLNGASGSNADIVSNGYTPTGTAHKDAVQNQASFIGGLAVGAMADAGNAVALETAARAVFDIMDIPTYNQKYYSSSLALLTMLFATGNFPTP